MATSTSSVEVLMEKLKSLFGEIVQEEAVRFESKVDNWVAVKVREVSDFFGNNKDEKGLRVATTK
ncbi:unnamed protein product [Dovyalis caffra]|uniref:Uncharacterized protein n=1 Tax=Dovyalis caffra TaxID=77055 RepID=A0AAV1RD00_9ROSI|nr:unnamed protein product [Dovyalis caffra]